MTSGVASIKAKVDSLMEDLHENQATVKVVMHLTQMELTTEFRQFDYGKEKNLEIYNDHKPPCIKYENIQVPISLYVGGIDPLCTIPNCSQVRDKL